jgi:protein-S-isoprenylcysteine O-methyltransferase Ste14
MEEFTRWFLPIYLVMFFIVAFVWRTLRVKKLTGINPYVLGKADNAHDFIGRIFRVTTLLVFVAVVLNTVPRERYRGFSPFEWLESDSLRWFAIFILLGALIWVATAQMQMGRSWRIGIDTENRTELVQSGIFSLSRNPIFLGMRTMLFGLFLMIPNALTLLTWILGDVLMQIQVRLEEEFLEEVHGDTYNGYRSRVRRWI